MPDDPVHRDPLRRDPVHREPAPLALLLCRAGLATKAAVERRLASHRLSYLQYQLLVELTNEAGIHPREAARQLGWSRQAMVVAARALGRRGLVRLERRLPDRRLVRLHLTEAGDAVLAELRPRVQPLERVIGRLAHPLAASRFAAVLDRLVGATPFAATREWRWESEFG